MVRKRDKAVMGMHTPEAERHEQVGEILLSPLSDVRYT